MGTNVAVIIEACMNLPVIVGMKNCEIYHIVWITNENQ